MTQRDYPKGRLMTYIERGQELAEACARKAEEMGGLWTVEAAEEFIREYLRNGPASGEDIVDAAEAAGLVPHSAKAFGAPFARLSRRGVIVRDGFVLRRKGHGTAGASVWRLA